MYACMHACKRLKAPSSWWPSRAGATHLTVRRGAATATAAASSSNSSKQQQEQQRQQMNQHLVQQQHVQQQQHRVQQQLQQQQVLLLAVAQRRAQLLLVLLLRQLLLLLLLHAPQLGKELFFSVFPLQLQQTANKALESAAADERPRSVGAASSNRPQPLSLHSLRRRCR
ncbi:hypothetical protein Efla_004949 [Eimeria flavescens]